MNPLGIGHCAICRHLRRLTGGLCAACDAKAEDVLCRRGEPYTSELLADAIKAAEEVGDYVGERDA